MINSLKFILFELDIFGKVGKKMRCAKYTKIESLSLDVEFLKLGKDRVCDWSGEEAGVFT